MIVAPWRRLLVDHDFALGCPLAATICDAADNDTLRTHVSERFGWWASASRRRLRQVRGAGGGSRSARDGAMAALEGALMLARAQRSIEPLDTVERFFALGLAPILDHVD